LRRQQFNFQIGEEWSSNVMSFLTAKKKNAACLTRKKKETVGRLNRLRLPVPTSFRNPQQNKTRYFIATIALTICMCIKIKAKARGDKHRWRYHQ
jgi:hypothetical protein